MGLEKVFVKGVNTAFKVFKDAVRAGQYYSIKDTGFPEDNTDFPISIIEGSFSENDIKYLSFSEFIQPQDVKGLVKGSDIKVEVHSQSDKIAVTNKDLSTSTFTIVAFDTDPMKVLYTFLLRKT